jgi:Domain of unknown function (DUF4407)
MIDLTSSRESPPPNAPEVRLFLRTPRRASRSMELLRLDTWGDTLLGTKLRGELGTGYAILLVVCVFEVLAWSLLFNYMFHGAQMEASLATIPAMLLGTLWGLGIFTIDKGLITADLLRAGWTRYVGVAARAALVLGAALLTAQPIEQLVFRSRVEEQLKQAILREEAIAYAAKSEELKLRRDDIDQRRERTKVPARIQQELDEQKRASEQISVRYRDAMQEAARAESARQQAEERLASARWSFQKAQQQDPPTPALAGAERRLRIAVAAHREAAADFDDAQGALKAAEAERAPQQHALDAAKASFDAADKGLRSDHDGALGTLEQEGRGFRQFLERVRSADFGAPLQREDGTPFKWKRAGAVERMEALAQLRDGDPPPWPAASPEVRKQAALLAGLGDDASSSSHERSHMFTLWLVVVIIGAAIPSLSLFYKFTMSQELKLYYSIEAQARAGNPEAIALLRVRDELPSPSPGARADITLVDPPRRLDTARLRAASRP